MKLEFSRQILEKNTQIPNLMKIRPVVAELVHLDWRTDRSTDGHDEAISRFLQFFEHAQKNLNL